MAVLSFVALTLALAVRPGSQPVLRHSAQRTQSPQCVTAVKAPAQTSASDAISDEEPLNVLIAGAGVGGLILANCLELSGKPVTYTVLERTGEFKKFGGPIQLASNAMQAFREIDPALYSEIEGRATWTGNRTNGIKDGIRDEWYAKFDLKSPAESRGMPFTCVVDRPDLQDILLKRVGHNVRNNAGVESYTTAADGSVTVQLNDGNEVHGDVLIGADGIWSNVRASMTDTPTRGPESGVTYSGYTVFAGELAYGGGDPECGYKVYIGPQQYFVITDIGRGNYQWYAFLARPANSEADEPKPDGTSPYLQNLFDGWSPEVIDILKATQEHEIEQRDLYDRPPSVTKPWTDGHVALLGDAIHAMMPNLGQGGCQALEDASVISEMLTKATKRTEVTEALSQYRNRRLTRSAAVQGLSRFASDIIIRGFDTPCKVGFYEGAFVFENVNYAGIVTRLLQPILPIFFAVQFAFLYDGYKNEFKLDDLKYPAAIAFFGLGILFAFSFVVGGEVALGGLALEGLIGAEAAEGISLWVAEQSEAITQIVDSIGGGAGGI
eukprot:CAMPEP_0115859012 /NCGR_PEP_ID=MMETSP0287-20121206/16393_1 /TAXON_ID=412157 /ORGANISM="Chrysochromulina rotalis, Strain UIO044" /LENGTH=551 /DNA_ID=CAMNT_0003313293 /DNA_START=338 /DNA_END=1993 /DNA_ORIENTATION=+